VAVPLLLADPNSPHRKGLVGGEHDRQALGAFAVRHLGRQLLRRGGHRDRHINGRKIPDGGCDSIHIGNGGVWINGKRVD
jgi:hypothetical protein